VGEVNLALTGFTLSQRAIPHRQRSEVCCLRQYCLVPYDDTSMETTSL